MINQNMVKYLREQYPPGTRIRLNHMEDPYAPIEPGTLGTVMAVDDIGDLIMKWDNGRSLNIVPGEDSFSVLPQEPTLLKLYMPMSVDYYERSEWGDCDEEPSEMGNAEAVGYADNILAALLRERHSEESGRGMMTYYGKNDSVNDKVRSYNFTSEVRDGRLWGVAECQVVGELTQEELQTLIDAVSGQASDGLGEGFEQRDIKVGDYVLNAHLWSPDDSWSIQTEQELFSPKLAEGLPELCFSVLASTGDLICIKRGENGYYPSDWNTDRKERNQELADYNNERLGVTDAQRQAMECGSMFGWGVPGADPAAYEQETPQMGGMTLE